MEEEMSIEADHIIENMLKNEFGIKTSLDYMGKEENELAVIYENIKAVQEEYGLSDDDLEKILENLFES